VFKETPTAEELAEANSHAKLSCSDLLLNDVICIWFSNKKLFTLATVHLKIHRLTDYTHLLEQRIKTLAQNAFFTQKDIQF